MGTIVPGKVELMSENAGDTRRPFAIVTWPFGLRACELIMRDLSAGESALDSVEAGIRLVEDALEVDTVGLGGLPNSDGVVELDAGIMCGPGRRTGAVAGLRGIKEAISVARKVMEATPHCLLVGEGARDFAIEHGFAPTELLTLEARKKWQEWKLRHRAEDTHDTVCAIALDKRGDICVGTSTSGIAFKLPGRVGDTPLIGCGFYCDNAVGGAAATGVGESIMRYAMSFRIVDAMRRGASPLDACESTMAWAIKDDPRLLDVSVNVIAMNKDGEFGAAASREGFTAAKGNSDGVMLSEVGPVSI